MRYTYDAVCFAKHDQCADDRLLRPSSSAEAVWTEFKQMKAGKDYSWINPWSTRVKSSVPYPFKDEKSVLSSITEGSYVLKKEKDKGKMIVMAGHPLGTMYFFYRIRQITSKEMDEMMDLCLKYKWKLAEVSDKLSKISKSLSSLNL